MPRTDITPFRDDTTDADLVLRAHGLAALSGSANSDAIHLHPTTFKAFEIVTDLGTHSAAGTNYWSVTAQIGDGTTFANMTSVTTTGTDAETLEFAITGDQAIDSQGTNTYEYFRVNFGITGAPGDVTVASRVTIL